MSSPSTTCQVCAAELPAGLGPDEPCPACGAVHPDAWMMDATTATHGDPGATMRTGMPADGTADGTMPRQRRTARAGGAPDAEAEYVIGDVVGRGGIGQVHAADQAALGRRLAIKVLRPERGVRSGARSRFLAEALVTASLDHPGIVPVHDLGLDSDGNPFYAMKLVDGRPWGATIDRTPRDQNLEILLKVCDAIAYAHSKGIIHRDLKPDNVMIGPFGEVLVVDWGLAARIGAAMTAASARAGTPACMAPEMALGEAGLIGPASDVYLLGGLLLRILSGKPPHPGATAGEAMAAAARNELAALPAGDPQSIVAARALAAAPGDRFPDAQAFKTAVREAIEHGESIELALRASRDLAWSREAAGHARFAETVQACREALRMWPENPDAKQLLAECRLAWAERACDLGDFELAAGQIAQLGGPEAGRLAERIRSEQAALRRRRRRSRGLAITAIALGGLLLSALAVFAHLAWRAERNLRDAAIATSAARAEADSATEKANQAHDASADREQRRSRAFALYAQATGLMRRGREVGPILRLLDRALETDPGLIPAWYALGDARRRNGDGKGASEAFLHCDRLSRSTLGKPSLQALYAAARCLDDFGYMDRSTVLFNEVVRIGGDHIYADIARGNLLLADLRPAEAVELAERAVAAAPHIPETRALAGMAWLVASRLGDVTPGPRVENAIAHLRILRDMAPSHAGGAFSLGRALLMRARPEDVEEGRRLVALSLDLEPGNPANAANVLAAGTDLIAPETEARARRLIAEADQDNPVVQLSQSYILDMGGDLRGAVATFDRCAAQVGQIPVFLMHQLYMDLRVGERRESAERRIDALIAAGRNWAGLEMLQCSRLEQRGDPVELQRALAASLARAPYNTGLLWCQAKLSARQGDWAAVAASLTAINGVDPGNAKVFASQVEVLCRLGRGSDARATLERMAQLYPSHPDLPRLRTAVQGLGR